MNGILNVFKPAGMTSYDVIRVVKKVSGQKKIGHLGTLDPLAEGVLPLFLGKMTKLIPHFNLDDKTYQVQARFGARSTTLDREGELTPVPVPESCTCITITTALNGFVGESEQVPPMFSAVKVKGKKLYEYARKGETIDRKTRRIKIHWIKNVQCRLPDLSFEVHCSKGTYIRSLVHDLGVQTGTGAYLTGLTRTRAGRFFTDGNAIKLDKIKLFDKIDLQRHFIDPQYLFTEWNHITTHSPDTIDHLGQGRSISVEPDTLCLSEKGKQFLKCLVKDQQHRLIAIGRLEFSQDGHGTFHPSNVLI
ncbi:MAG: tRNA pseudouridine(55) synthase TruB [bacterium]